MNKRRKKREKEEGEEGKRNNGGEKDVMDVRIQIKKGKEQVQS